MTRNCCDDTNLTLFVNLVLCKALVISHVVHSIIILYYYGFAHNDALYILLSAVFNITTDTDLEVCELESLPLAFSIMCVVDPAAVLLWEVTGVTPPLGGAIARGETVRSFTCPNVIGQSILNVNDPSRLDMGNQTCFICRADYPSGSFARSDPLCVDVSGTLIFDVTVIVYNTTTLVVVGSKKVHMLTIPHMHAYMSAHSYSIALKGLYNRKKNVVLHRTHIIILMLLLF